LNAALLQPSQPVLTTGLAALVGLEPLRLGTLHGRLKLAGILMAAGGAFVTVYFDSLAATSHHSNGTAAHGTAAQSTNACGGAVHSSPSLSDLITGNALLGMQCLSGAAYQLLQKHLLSNSETDYPPLAVAGLGYAVGAMAIGLVLPVCHADATSWSWLWLSPHSVWALAYAIVMTSAFNYALQAYANKHSSPTMVTAFFPLQIVFTALFAWLATGKRPLPMDYVGALWIIGGLAAVTWGRVIAGQVKTHPHPSDDGV